MQPGVIIPAAYILPAHIWVRAADVVTIRTGRLREFVFARWGLEQPFQKHDNQKEPHQPSNP